MPNHYFAFKEFIIYQQNAAMKVATDSCLLGAWCAHYLANYLPEKTLQVLDIGTGTGLLSLMIAQKNTATIEAIEIDENAFLQAQKNVAESKFANKIKVYHANIFNCQLVKKYDALICNPPFYQNHLTSPNATRSLAHHAQNFTLEKLCTLFSTALAQEGVFFLLLPYTSLPQAKQLLQHNGLFANSIVAVKHSVNHAANRALIQGSWKNYENPIIELIIKNSENQYTPQFKEILKDYYLEF